MSHSQNSALCSWHSPPARAQCRTQTSRAPWNSSVFLCALIYMANKCLDTSKALKSCEENAGLLLRARQTAGLILIVPPGLFIETPSPPELVLEQSCDMLFRVFLNIEGTFYQKCLNSRLQSEKGRYPSIKQV